VKAINAVIGTAGHIDHGKTSLVRALTEGAAENLARLDRLKAEKERGITIELGFARLALPSGRVAGVVDVPGHERFVRTMVAGATGIDLVVLVVAADEGIMPQTREHLDICTLLGVQRGVVALSKCDLVDGELRELAVSELREGLGGGPFADAPIVPVSVKTGEGLAALVAEIDARLETIAERDAAGLPRLPVDRAFSMKGFGTVVTGTLAAGRLAVGDELEALPRGERFKVRGIQVHGETVEAAAAGQRTALNLAAPRGAVERGDVLGRAGELEAGRLIDVRLRLLGSANAPLKRRARLVFHAATAQRLVTVTLLDKAELAPGSAALAQVQLDAPMVLMPGDRFVLRGFVAQKHHGTTVGGGVVLRTLGARHRRGTPELIAALEACERAGPDERVALEVERAGRYGLDRAALWRRLPFAPKIADASVARLLSSRRLVRFDKERGALVAGRELSALENDALAAVTSHHEAHPLAAGMPREELRERLGVDARLLHAVVEALGARLHVDRDVARLPSHDPARSNAAQGLTPLADRLRALYEQAALSPPRLAEAAVTLAVPVVEAQKATELLARAHTLVRIGEHYFARTTIDNLRERLRTFLVEKGSISAQAWKELTATTRKYSIPLAEHFDAEKLTLRVGDLRKLRR
jgi:selenocysteine-specific elongation factor